MRGVLDAAALAVVDRPVDGLLAAVVLAAALLVARLLAAALLAAELLVARLLAAELLVAGCVVVLEDPPPAGDGVRDAECVAEPDDVSGVGTKVDGTEEPPPMQAETVTVSRTAPAARRPAASHASRVAAGVLSRIFMDPPRTRVRNTR